MDVAELSSLVNMVVPKLADGFGSNGILVKDVEAGMLARVGSTEPSMCFVSEEDAMNMHDVLESISQETVASIELSQLHDQVHSFPWKVMSKETNYFSTRNSSRSTRLLEGKLQRKVVKGSQRSIVDSHGVCDSKNSSDTHGKMRKSYNHEGTWLPKQKKKFCGKQGESKNFKVPTKIRSVAFFPKEGSTSSTAGGNNTIGMNGAQADANNFWELVENVPLNDLLNGTYRCPNLSKHKPAKVPNGNRNIMCSFRKACSILRHPHPSSQLQNFFEISMCSEERIPSQTSHPVPVMANGDYGESCTTDPSSSFKDSFFEHESAANLLCFPLDQPKHILELLALPPAMDLKCLLLDTKKPVISSRNIALCSSGKQTSHATMPPFAWSFGGHGKTSADASKFYSCRIICQGRCSVMENAMSSSMQSASESAMDFDSFRFNEALVPFLKPNQVIPEKSAALSSISEKEPALALSVSCSGHVSISASDKATLHLVYAESEGDPKEQEAVEHCPKVMAAAQILCDMAAESRAVNPNGRPSWQKRQLVKGTKTQKSKPAEKNNKILGTSLLSPVAVDARKTVSIQAAPLKRARPSSKNASSPNGVQRGPPILPARKSSALAPANLRRA